MLSRPSARMAFDSSCILRLRNANIRISDVWRNSIRRPPPRFIFLGAPSVRYVVLDMEIPVSPSMYAACSPYGTILTFVLSATARAMSSVSGSSIMPCSPSLGKQKTPLARRATFPSSARLLSAKRTLLSGYSS